MAGVEKAITMRFNFLLVVGIVVVFSGVIEARDGSNLGIKMSMSLEKQLKRLQGIGFECDQRSREISEQWQCARSSQVVNLGPRRILLACLDDGACWPESIDLIRDIAPKSAATSVKPVTLYRSGGSVHLHCLTVKGNQSVCAESWASSKRPLLAERYARRSALSPREQATGE